MLTELAIIGTTGILGAIKQSAPTVKRVVITSSSAAIMDRAKTFGKKYLEVNTLSDCWEVYLTPLGGLESRYRVTSLQQSSRWLPW